MFYFFITYFSIYFTQYNILLEKRQIALLFLLTSIIHLIYIYLYLTDYSPNTRNASIDLKNIKGQ